MLFTRRTHNPNNEFCFDSGGVCNQLSEVGMIGAFKLIFYDYFFPCILFLTEDINMKSTDICLRLNYLDPNSNLITEFPKIFRFRKPPGEVQGFVLPMRAQVEFLKAV